jgi:hypothetical protein
MEGIPAHAARDIDHIWLVSMIESLTQAVLDYSPASTFGSSPYLSPVFIPANILAFLELFMVSPQTNLHTGQCMKHLRHSC